MDSSAFAFPRWFAGIAVGVAVVSLLAIGFVLGMFVGQR